MLHLYIYIYIYIYIEHNISERPGLLRLFAYDAKVRLPQM